MNTIINVFSHASGTRDYTPQKFKLRSNQIEHCLHNYKNLKLNRIPTSKSDLMLIVQTSKWLQVR